MNFAAEMGSGFLDLFNAAASSPLGAVGAVAIMAAPGLLHAAGIMGNGGQENKSYHKNAAGSVAVISAAFCAVHLFAAASGIDLMPMASDAVWADSRAFNLGQAGSHGLMTAGAGYIGLRK